MKILHISFHKGCSNDLTSVLNKLGHTHELLTFKEDDGQHYNMTAQRADYYWNLHKEYFNTFDCIITSDTAPISRIFLQNNWEKKLIIWICNRFDYAHGRRSGFPDKEYYQLFKKATKMPNVHIIGYTPFENYYCKYIRNIDIGTNVIKPTGCLSKIYQEGCLGSASAILCNPTKDTLHATFIDSEKKKIIFIPPYHNDTNMINLSSQLDLLGIKNFCGKYSGPLDLMQYKAVVHIPYAWSNLALFEAFHLGIVYFIPSPSFLNKISQGKNFFWSPPFISSAFHLSEWYCHEYNDLFIYFNSWDDLKLKINQTNFGEWKKKLIAHSKIHTEQTLNSWKKIL